MIGSADGSGDFSVPRRPTNNIHKSGAKAPVSAVGAGGEWWQALCAYFFVAFYIISFCHQQGTTRFVCFFQICGLISLPGLYHFPAFP